MKKIYIVTDLGPGDGGKGGVVHKIATMMNAHTVIKVGGSQGSHGVKTSEGFNYAFSYWGCGTFEGIRTHISSRMIVHPIGLLNEAELIRYGGFGIYNLFDLLTIDEEALCATPYHGIVSRLKEMARGDDPRGTIGTGVGESYRYSQQYPDLAIQVRDLLRPNLRDQLIAVREQIQRDLSPIIEGEFFPEDRKIMEKEVYLLYDDGYLDFILKQFQKAGQKAKTVDHDYLGKKILSKNGVAVVESSHGVLTDHYHGFYPHTSAIRTLPCFTQTMLKEAGFDGQIVNIGVFRAYAIRHGAGPMPTADPTMAENLLPGSHKEENRWQGKIRVGPIDLVLLRYAINVCGGPSAFDGLAVTWFDQIERNGQWKICKQYNNKDTDNRTYFTSSGEIKVRQGIDDEQSEYQRNLGRRLLSCRPEITTLKIPSDAKQEELYSFCADVSGKELGIPVRMVSLGPTERDKICK
ncbi:MAG: adenylosuccinate synthetase [Candidatus Pacebacteria bacterium]|nr:adenylosuccinate synthetase [Candidatus Paceibacterota bacterium]